MEKEQIPAGLSLGGDREDLGSTVAIDRRFVGDYKVPFC